MTFAHCGISQVVTNIDASSETSTEVDQFNAFYDTVLEAVLMQWMPDFAQKQETLNLIQENPNLTWSYEYTYPSDCLLATGITDGSRLGVDAFAEVEYQVSNNGSDRVIWTNESAASLDYVHNFAVVSKMPSSFALAFSYIMAGHIAPSITENRNSGQALAKRGEMEMAKAMAGQYNERGRAPQADAEVIRGR